MTAAAQEAPPRSGVQAFRREADLSQLATTKEGVPKPTYGNLCIYLRHDFHERLGFDEMALMPTLDGVHVKEVLLGQIREELERRHGVAFSKDALDDAVRQIGSERTSHPVRRYLETLPNWDGVPRIERVLPDILGVEPRKLVSAYMSAFFVSAIARAVEPGCKVDNVLVMHGKQAAQKSTFFRVIGEPWFSDSHLDIRTRQAFLTISAAWIYEFAEIDSIVGTREDPDVKRFLSSAEDSFVPPYGRAPVKHGRSCVIVGTTNKRQFLKDHTGNRRYWIVTVGDRIDVAKLRAWRDQLWAEALVLFYDGRPWWLSPELEQLQAQANAEYEYEDPWFERIATWLGKPRVASDALTTTTILADGVNVPMERQTKGEEMRVGAIMHRLGYTSRLETCTRPDGKPGRRRVWSLGGEEGGEP